MKNKKMEINIKQARDSTKYGRVLKTTTFEIMGNPPHVLAFKEVTKKSKNLEYGRGRLNKNNLCPFLL